MPKRGHQPRGLLPSDPGQYIVTISASSVVQGAIVTAFAQFATSDGSPVADAGRVVTWGKVGSGGSFSSATSSTNIHGVAEVSLTVGIVIGGTYTITARDTHGVTGTSPTVTVVADLVPASLTVTPATENLLIGGTQQLTVVAKNVIGTVLSSASASWLSSNPSVASVSTSGLVAGLSSGTASITASLLGITSNASVATVAFDTVPASIAIVPTSATLSGGTVQLTAAVKNAAGQVIPGLQPSGWASSASSIASVDSTGLVTWVSQGSATITATLGALTSNGCAITANAVVGGGGGGAQTLATVDLPTTTLTTSIASTPTGGSTIHVASGGNLQAALDAAVPGDTITLEAGATWTGNYTITPRGGGIAGAWIFVKSDGSLPAEGVRMTAANAIAYNLPKIRSTSGAAASLAASGALAKFRFIGVLIVPDLSVASMNTIVNLGTGSETALVQFPSDVILDRCYIAGHPTLECRRGVTLNSYRTAIIDGSIQEIHSTGFDSQAILGWNGPGVYKIENNYLEASSEVVAFGGADPAYVGHNPSDIEIKRNWITRPMAWKTSGWLIKCLVELKKGVRTLIEGNVIENSWASSQTFAILLWSVNQNAGDPTAETGHVTIRKNVIRNVAGVFNLTDGYHGNGAPFVPLHHVAINNNVMIGIDNPNVIGGDKLCLIQAGTDSLFIEHNTGFIPTQSALVYTVATGQRLTNHKFRNNLTGGGTYPLFMSPGPKWADITGAGCEFSGNVVVGPDAAYFASLFGFPATGNSYPASESALGLSGGASKTYDVNASPSDLALSVSSAYHLAGTDGTDPGADVPAVLTAVTGVGGGF